MSHTISDRNRAQRDAVLHADEIARQTDFVREGLEFAGKVVDIWNNSLAGGLELFFSPTIRAAIVARKPILTFYCPACQVTGDLDLRKVDRHRGASITSLIPALSCQRCVPTAPFAKLTGLHAAGPDRAPRNLDFEAVMIVRKARDAAMRKQREQE